MRYNLPVNETLAHRLAAGPVVVTGAGGAVAPVVALRFLRSGAKVVLIARDGSQERVAESLPGSPELAASGRLLILGADLADEASARGAIDEVTEQWGPPAVLLNIAGGFKAEGASEAGSAGLERQLDINLRTAVNATLATLPAMRERRNGAVAVIGAAAARTEAPGRTAYAAAKAALAAYFRSLAAEVSGDGIVVSVLHPMGAIDTPANRSAMPRADASRWIAPDAVAAALEYLVSGGQGGAVRELELFGLP